MKNIKNFINGSDKSKYSTTDSFELLYKGWAVTATIANKPTRLLKIYHLLFFRFIILVSPVTFLVSIWKSFEYVPFMETLCSVQALLNIIPLPIKTIIITIYAKRLRNANEIFMRLDQRYQRQVEYAQIKECVVTCRRIFVFTFAIYWLYGCVTLVVAISKNQQPYGLWLPFVDLIPYTNLRYYSNVLFKMLYALVLVQCQVNNDSYMAIYMRAIRTHINLLSERVLRLGTNSESSADETLKELVDCIISHRELLDAAKSVHAVVSLTIFMQFALAAIILCVSMINFLIFLDGIYQVVTVIYYICVIMQTAPACYQASMLEADCEKLPLAIFHCNWLALDKHSRKMIPYFMQHAQEGIPFTALKLFKIDLTTNLAIAKFSFTLYTFITAMGLEEKLKDRFRIADSVGSIVSLTVFANISSSKSKLYLLGIKHTCWSLILKNHHKRFSLHLVMQRAQQDITFTAIKLFQINLKTNLSIAKFSFSLHTFSTEMGFGQKTKEQFS